MNKHSHTTINAFFEDDKERDCETVVRIVREELQYWSLRIKQGPDDRELKMIREWSQPFYDQGTACLNLLHPGHSRRTAAE